MNNNAPPEKKYCRLAAPKNDIAKKRVCTNIQSKMQKHLTKLHANTHFRTIFLLLRIQGTVPGNNTAAADTKHNNIE